MNYADLLRLRDEAIKNEILGLLTPERRREFEEVVEQGFREGERFWAEEQVVTLIGREGRDLMCDDLHHREVEIVDRW